MEEIYMNAEYDKFDNAKNCTGPRKYKIPKEFLPRHRGVILCLGLLSFFLLIGLITLGVYFHDSAADVSAVGSKLSSMTEERDLLKANLSTTGNKLSSMTEERDLLKANLSTNRNKLSSMTEERDLLQANLAEKTNELERLQSLSKQNKACPAGWSRFSYSCYLLSETSGSWDVARKDCRDRGADLVVIDSPEDQTALSNIATTEAWIGLNDKEQEGTWKWVDGTPLTLIPAGNWEEDQPDNGGGSSHWGEEDCVHVRTDTKKSWNDRSCSTSFKWICEKTP